MVFLKKYAKRKKRHDRLPSVDIDNNYIKVEEMCILGNDIETLVPSSEEQPRKSKKKKHKDNSDQGLTEISQNGITEWPSFTENSVSNLGAVSGTVLENMKKKHKKKHKRSSVIEDSALESTNGGTDFASQEPQLENLTIQQETPKQKKHKKKHLDKAASDVGAYLALDRNVLRAGSHEFAEPK
ncbi:unnamed protein product, partial [Staurois parvus]